MYSLKEFQLLLEVRFSDIAIMNSDVMDKKLSDKITTNINKEFEANTEFLDNYRVKNVLFNLKYNHNKEHDLLKRIKDRTALKNISEFNSDIISFLNRLDYEKIVSNKFDKYDVYFKANDYHLIATATVVDEKLKLVRVLIITVLKTNEMFKNMIRLTI